MSIPDVVTLSGGHIKMGCGMHMVWRAAYPYMLKDGAHGK